MGNWQLNIEPAGTGLGPCNFWLRLTPTGGIQFPILEGDSIAKVPGKNYFGVWWGRRAVFELEVDEIVDGVDVVDDEVVHLVHNVHQVHRAPWRPNHLTPNLEMIHR